ncbi:hypothetical protein PQX77_014543 [Marasmius sp. AFHP31]|nr:hypothetical protein PQX77_014543 [Marasmius sp. AFHP31]
MLLQTQWRCGENELWVDTARGVICRGPVGPDPDLPWRSSIEIENPPSTVDLLQEPVLLRFLATLKSKEVDHTFLEAIRADWNDGNLTEVPEPLVNQPTVLTTSSNTPIAFANQIWKNSGGVNLEDQKMEGNELTRFRLRECETRQTRLLELVQDADDAWLSQACSTFHAGGISLEDDLNVFTIIWAHSWLSGFLSESETEYRKRSEQPIHLFLRSPPPGLPDCEISSLHFWSFKDDGQYPLSAETCDELGLPTTFQFASFGRSRSWSTNHYKLIHKYQLLRGFAPATTDFSRHLGLDVPAFQSTNDADRFEIVAEGDLYPTVSLSALNTRPEPILVEYSGDNYYSSRVPDSNGESNSFCSERGMLRKPSFIHGPSNITTVPPCSPGNLSDSDDNPTSDSESDESSSECGTKSSSSIPVHLPDLQVTGGTRTPPCRAESNESPDLVLETALHDPGRFYGPSTEENIVEHHCRELDRHPIRILGFMRTTLDRDDAHNPSGAGSTEHDIAHDPTPISVTVGISSFSPHSAASGTSANPERRPVEQPAPGSSDQPPVPHIPGPSHTLTTQMTTTVAEERIGVVKQRLSLLARLKKWWRRHFGRR